MPANRKQLLDRRVARNRKTLSVGPRVFFVVFVGSIGTVWLMALGVLSLLDQESPSQHRNMLEQGFGDAPVDLWPSDRQSNTQLGMLVSCIPQDVNDETCRQRRPQGSTTQRVGFARTPGTFGLILQKFTQDVIQNHPIENDFAELFPSTHILKNHSFTKIIRFAVLPMLLEAADLALGAIDSSLSKQQITVSDIEDIVRLLVHWHCRVSEIANDTALLTLSAKTILSRPKDTAKEIGSFIGFAIGDDEDLMTGKAVDRRATNAMNRIDECSSFISHLQRQSPGQNLQDLADTIIHNEITGGECGHMDTNERFRKSRLTKIVRQLLGPDSEKVCDEFPTIALCTNPLSSV